MVWIQPGLQIWVHKAVGNRLLEAARDQRRWTMPWIGLSWGIGHGIPLLVIGTAIVALRVTVSDGLASSAELGVGVLMIALGVMNLVRSDAADRGLGLRGAATRSGIVGLAHGLAGSGAIALLAAAAMPTAQAAIAYLAAFSVGTIGAMVAFSWLLGFPLTRLGLDGRGRRTLVAATGALSILVGLGLIARIAVGPGVGALG